jgi:hypothetical protein
MPRANRHYIPGYVWHITHRCHKKEFLLKFARDRRRWLRWLFEAKKRYGLSVLNYTLIDYEGLRSLFDFSSMHDFAEAHRGWVEKSLEEEILSRDERWTESVAVGSERFVEAAKEELGLKAKGREVIGDGGSYYLKESPATYKGNLASGNVPLRLQNEYFWEYFT